MRLIINGEEKQTDAATVRELVIELGRGEQAVAVEHNREVVPRKLQNETLLKEGDVLELVTLVGGG